MLTKIWILLLIFTFSTGLFAQDAKEIGADVDSDPYWEYGLGLGYAHFEQYPASNQFSSLLLPFPTFQYRGKILRANDREGARAFLLRGSNWNLDMSGTGYVALDSSNNEARRGMDNLPWILAVGPRLVYTVTENLKLNLGIFQAISTDFQMTRFAGGLFEGDLSYQWPGEHTFSKASFKVKAGTRDFLGIYFDVPADKVTSERSEYESRSGFLSSEISYLQAFKFGRGALYLGGAVENYSHSANRNSPLHKADTNLSYLVGMTYVLDQSAKPAVREEDASGVINRWRKQNPDQ